jgi:hypothetical protein
MPICQTNRHTEILLSFHVEQQSFLFIFKENNRNRGDTDELEPCEINGTISNKDLS